MGSVILASSEVPGYWHLSSFFPALVTRVGRKTLLHKELYDIVDCILSTYIETRGPSSNVARVGEPFGTVCCHVLPGTNTTFEYVDYEHYMKYA